MKNIISILTFFLFIGTLYSQNLEQNIQEIRKQFRYINSQKDLKSVILENQEFTDFIPSEGAGLDGYYRNDTLYKIVENEAVSNAVYTNEYYLKNDQLIFVYRTEKSLIFHDDGTTSAETNYEERVYYKNGKIIRHLKKGPSVLKEDIDFQKQFKDYFLLLNTEIKYKAQFDKLQGSWSNVDDIDDWFEIKGLLQTQYDRDAIIGDYRFWINGRYLYFRSAADKQINKFELLELTDKKLEMQNRASGEVFIYEKDQI